MITPHDIADVITLIGTALTADATFLAFCTAQFTKAPAVYVGIDRENPPEESAYPVCAMTDIREISDVAENRRSFEVEIGFGVSNSTITVSGELITYAGFVLAERFREAGERAILKAAASPNAVFSGYAERIQMYPIFVSYTVLTVAEVVSRRQPRY